jgi:tetratricopeptide (TPR) repeat protein
MAAMDATRTAIEKAEGFLTLGMGSEAWETLEDLSPEAKNDQRVLELRLEILCHEKEWQKAVILGESIIAALPRSALARYYLAVARCQSGDMAGAKDVLKSAIELDETLRARALDEPGLSAVW